MSKQESISPTVLSKLKRALTWMETFKRVDKIPENGPLTQDIQDLRATIRTAKVHTPPVQPFVIIGCNMAADTRGWWLEMASDEESAMEQTLSDAKGGSDLLLAPPIRLSRLALQAEQFHATPCPDGQSHFLVHVIDRETDLLYAEMYSAPSKEAALKTAIEENKEYERVVLNIVSEQEFASFISTCEKRAAEYADLDLLVKSVEFAYPSSDRAALLGHSKHGCWTVQLRDPRSTKGVTIHSVHASREDAIQAASPIKVGWCPHLLALEEGKLSTANPKGVRPCYVGEDTAWKVEMEKPDNSPFLSHWSEADARQQLTRLAVRRLISLGQVVKPSGKMVAVPLCIPAPDTEEAPEQISTFKP